VVLPVHLEMMVGAEIANGELETVRTRERCGVVVARSEPMRIGGRRVAHRGFTRPEAVRVGGIRVGVGRCMHHAHKRSGGERAAPGHQNLTPALMPKSVMWPDDSPVLRTFPLPSDDVMVRGKRTWCCAKRSRSIGGSGLSSSSPAPTVSATRL